MNRLYCDHCGLEVQKLNVMVFGKMTSNRGGRAYQERLDMMTMNAEEMEYGNPSMMAGVGQAVNTLKQSAQYNKPPTPLGAFKAAEVCDNCITPWMNGVANICNRSDP